MVLITVVPPLFVVKLVTAVPLPPTTPPKVVVPAVFTAQVLAPLIVDTKPMSPGLVLAKVVAAPKVTAPL